MKTQRRRGFTVVELVVVIAIIAVLAAVLIPTFTSIIKKANDSAALQERTNQRLEDIAQKVDNANWLSWEDFEGKLAEELAKINKDTVTKDDVTAAVNAALKTYADEHGTSGSGITKEQVETIVKQAISEQGSLTTAQVEAVVKEAIANGAVSGVSEATVRQIVNSAVAGISKQTGVTKPEMQKAITEALKGVSGLTEDQVRDIVKKALSGFNTISESQVQKIVDDAIAGLDGWVYIAGDYEIKDGKTYVLRTDAPLSVVTISSANGLKATRVIIDAPNVTTVNVTCNVETLEIQRTAQSSTHIKGAVDKLIVNKGRAVVEAGASVATLTAAPSTNAKVTVVISGAVTTLNAQYQDNGTGTNDTIEIINAGSVGTANLTASEALEASGTTTTNVQVTNIGEQSSTSAANIAENASPYIPASETVEVSKATSVEAAEQGTTTHAGSTEVNGDYEARIGSQPYATFAEAVDAAGVNDVVVLLKDIDLASRYNFTKSVTINGAGFKIVAKGEKNSNGGRAFNVDGQNGLSIVLYNMTIEGGYGSYSRGISIYDSSNITLTLDNCSVLCGYYALNVASLTDNINLTLRNGSVSTGWAAINSYSNNSTYLIENSTLKGLNDKGQSSWNNFNTITIDGGGLGDHKDPGTWGHDNTITITNSTIYSHSDSSNSQYWVGLQYSAIKNTITVDANSKIIDLDGTDMTDNFHVGFYYSKAGTSGWTYYDCSSNKIVVGGVEQGFYSPDLSDPDVNYWG
jgi:prepilin-type N-terminal cleavage/methylation domain-containing protein